MKIKFCYSEPPLCRQLCRLCGSDDYHQKTILDNVPGSSTELSEKIYRCVGIRVETNDRMTKKICETCFKKINEFDRFRAACVATRMLTIANAVADPSNTKPNILPDVANDTESACSENWSVSVGGISCATSINDDINPNETESSQLATLGSDLLQSSQVRADPSTSDVIDLELTNAADSVVNLFLEGFIEYVQTQYAINASDASEMDNNSADNLTIAQTNSANGQQSDALNDAMVICISSAEDELGPDDGFGVAHAIEEGNGNASAETKIRSRRKAPKSVKRFLDKCRYGQCTELFESCDALMHHMENHHGEGINNVFSCHLCKKAFPGKRTLRTHFHYMHSRQMRFPCTIANCSKFFRTKRIMQEHINGMHTKEISFNCTKCSFKSYYKCNLMKHSALNHHHDE